MTTSLGREAMAPGGDDAAGDFSGTRAEMGLGWGVLGLGLVIVVPLGMARGIGYSERAENAWGPASGGGMGRRGMRNSNDE